jgi:hypothetical protein
MAQKLPKTGQPFYRFAIVIGHIHLLMAQKLPKTGQPMFLF